MNKEDILMIINSINYIEKSLNDYNDMDQRVFDELSNMRMTLNKYYNYY